MTVRIVMCLCAFLCACTVVPKQGPAPEPEHIPLSSSSKWETFSEKTATAGRIVTAPQAAVPALEQAVADLRASLKNETAVESDDSGESRAVVHFFLGTGLSRLGKARQKSALFDQARAEFEKAQEYCAKEVKSWCRVELRLQAALTDYYQGKLKVDPEPVKQAVIALQGAGEYLTQEKAPEQWASFQYHMGLCLEELGRQEGNLGYFREAVTAVENSLRVYDKQNTPELWARSQEQLGSILLEIGKADPASGALEKALAAFNNALEALTPEPASDRHADLHFGMGQAHLYLGAQAMDPEHLNRSVTLHRTALDTWSRSRDSSQWAKAHASIGDALIRLGKIHDKNEMVASALPEYEKALQAEAGEMSSYDRGATLYGYGNALHLLALANNNLELLLSASQAYKEALQTDMADNAYDKASIYKNLGRADSVLGMREKDVSLLCYGIMEQLQALDIYHEQYPDKVESMQRSLSASLQMLNESFPPEETDTCLCTLEEPLRRYEIIPAPEAKEGE